MKRFCHRLCVAILAIVSSCEEIESINPVVIAAIDKTYEADGYTLIPITVSLSVKKAKDEFRQLKVETTAGQFQTSTGLKNETLVKVAEDNSAIVYLVAGTSPGTYDIRASINSKPELFSITQVTLSSVLPDDVIDLELTSNRIEANGITLLHGELTLRKTDKRSVSFESTDKNAVFVGSTDNKLSLTADVNGKASFDLKPGLIAGKYTIVTKLNDSRNYQVTDPYDLLSVQTDSVITVKFDKPEGPFFNDGLSSIKGTIELKNTSTRELTIESTDKNAVFVGGTENKLSLVTDADGIASFALRPGLVAGAYTLIAKLVDSRNFQVAKPYNLLPVSADGIITLTLVPPETGVFNDGLSLIEGTIVLTNTETRQLTVECTDKEAIFLTDTDNAIELTVDSNLEAKFKLKVSHNAGEHFIIVKLNDERNLQISKSYQSAPLSSDKVLSLEIPSQTIFADGVTLVNAKVTVTNSSLRTVVLDLNQGEFLDPVGAKHKELSVEPDGSKAFSFRAGSSVPDGSTSHLYILSAKLANSNYAIQKEFQVMVASPSEMVIEPSTYTLNNDTKEATVRVVLFRTTGKVSDGVKVSFEAVQIVDGVEKVVGRFSNSAFTYSRNQEASIKFMTDQRSPVAGIPLKIRATTEKADGTSLTNSIEIAIE
ncbi:MAG: hypothetical protein RIE59_03080 [Imperialibacter sp.]